MLIDKSDRVAEVKTILVMRHAKSSWKDASLGDFDRPLNKRGKRAAPFMGQFLLAQDRMPETVYCSSAKRTRSTAKRMLREWPHVVPVVYREDLYHADSKSIAALVQSVPSSLSRIMILGHNPGLAEMIDELCATYVRFPTAAVAEIELCVSCWSEFSLESVGELKNLWLPRELMEE